VTRIGYDSADPNQARYNSHYRSMYLALRLLNRPIPRKANFIILANEDSTSKIRAAKDYSIESIMAPFFITISI
jgi:hypothetical protein